MIGAEGATVAPATLSVEITPRLFSLAFDATTVSVVAGATAQVGLALTGDTELIGENEAVEVMFAYESDDLDGGDVRFVALVPAMFTRGNTEAVVTLEAATTATRGTLTALVLEAEGAVVESATLSVEITPRLFSLAFDATTVSVVAGATAQVTLTLTGDTELIGENEAVEVMFAYESDDLDGGGVEVVALAPAMFTADNTEAVVTLSAATTAMGGVLTASVIGAEGATVAPATLGVEIIPRSYSLAFDVATVSVVAGATMQVTLVLTGDTEFIGENEAVEVMFAYESDDLDGGDVRFVALVPAMFTRGNTEAVVTLEAATTATGGMLTALVLEAEGATVAPATLSVEITPRLFSLAFDAETVSVVAGATAQVTLTLTGDRALAASDRFAVEFSYDLDGGGVEVVALESVEFSEGTTSATVTLSAATTATESTLTASVVGAEGATVAPATLSVEITPRLFSLAFDAETVSVVAGATAQVTLTLTGDRALAASDQFAVTFSYDLDGGGVEVVALAPAMFTADNTAAVVMLEAATTATESTLTASVVGAEGATVAPATLGVEIVPRAFTLAFDAETAAVVAGATTQVMLTLTGDTELIGKDEAFAATFTYTPSDPDGGVEVVESVEFSAGTTAATVTLSAATTATGGVLTASVSDADGATIEPAMLPVQVFHELTFSFATATPGEMPLEQARVLAGGATRVRVVLDNPGLLEGDEAVRVLRVSLSPGLVNISEVEPIRLTNANTSATFVITAAHDTPPLGTVRVTGQVVSGDIRVANKRVAPITLTVEIVPRRFRLSLEQFSQTESPNVLIANDSDTQSVRSIITVAEDIRIRLLLVQVDIRHMTIGDLRVVLVSPKGAEVVLHRRTGGTRNHINETYASLDHAGLAALVGERAEGPWTLTVGDYAGGFGGRLRSWTLGINTSALVLAGGDSVSLVASLAAVETPLGLPRLLAHEMLTVALTYDSANVEVLPSTLTFGGARMTTAIDVTLQAAVDATDGALAAVVADAPVNVEVAPAALHVRIIPRHFRLSLQPSGRRFSQTERPDAVIADNSDTQSVRSTITVAEDIEIRSLRVQVEIRGQVHNEIRIVLISPEGAEVLLDNRASQLPATYLSSNRAGLDALSGAPSQGEWVLTVGDYVPFDTGTLEAWSLEINGFTRVIAGGSASLVASLTAVETPLGSPRLLVHEMLTVALTYDGANVEVSPPTLMFGASSTIAAVTLEAAFNARQGSLTAEVVGASSNIEIVSEGGLVRIVPRRFQLSLRSASPLGAQLDAQRHVVGEASDLPSDLIRPEVRRSITVPVDTEIRWLSVRVDINHGARRELSVRLTSPEGVEVLLHNRTGGSGGIFRTYTSLNHAGMAVLIGAPAQGEWVLTVRDHDGPNNGRLQAFELKINTITPERFVGEASDGPLPIPDLGEVNSIITVPVNTEIQSLVVRVEIRHPVRGDLRVRLISPEGVEVLLHDQTEGFADDLFRTYTSAGHAGLAALTRGGTRGDWELIVADTTGALTGTLDGWGLEINTRTQLGTGESVPAVVTLSGVETLYGGSRLFPSETLLVELRYTAGDGVTMSPPTLEFHSLALTNLMMLEASLIQTSGLLELIGSGLTNAVVESTPVLVQVVRQFRLAFATPDGAPLAATRIMAGAATEVTVVLDSPETLEEGEVVQVTLSTEIVVASKPGLMLTKARSSETLVISAPADTDMPRGAVVASGELQLEDGTTADYIEVIAGSLAVEVILRTFRLAFHVARVPIVAGATTRVGLTLTGDDALAGDDRFAVMFSYVPDGGVEVAESVVFTAGSTETTVTLSVATTAMTGRLKASVAGIEGTDVAPATLGVEIVPRLFSLAFDTAMVSVVAGATAQVGLALTGDRALVASDRFVVEFSYDQDGGVGVVESVEFSEGTTTATVTLSAATTAMRGTLTALVVGADGATVAPATLDVEIVPRAFALVFDLASVSVVADATAQVTLTLTGDTELIGEDEAVEVMFAYDPSDSAGGGVRVARPVEFTAGNTAAVVMLEAATTATGGTLTASVLEAEGATVTPATLSVEVTPRAFVLAFDASTVSVIAGATTQVTLTVTGDRALAASDRFAVEFAYDPPDPDGGVEVVESVEFSEGTTAAVVTLEAATTATGGTLTASVLEAEGATVAPATLGVEVTPRAFVLAFDASTVSVIAGTTTQVTLALTGDTELIGENEAFAVMFSYDLDGGVEVVESVEFSEGTTAVTVTLSAATTATRGMLTASVLEAEGATVTPATLSVEITLRLFSLAFDAATVSVVAGGTTQVTLALTGDTELIGENEAFAVMFSYAPDGGVEVVESVEFSEGTTAVTVTLSAATTATRGMLTASVLEAEGATVTPATLSVEITLRLFSLAFDAATVSVVAGATAQVGLTLTGDTELIGENEAFAVMFSYAPDDLDGGGVEVVALAPAMFTADNTAAVVMLEAATTATGGVLKASVLDVDGATVTPATLSMEITPRLFSLAFDAATVSVVAGATAQVGLALTGDTELIGENEAFAVMFSYAPDDLDGGGVEVVALAPAMFTADNTAAVVMLEAATTATGGMLTALVLEAEGATVAPATLGVGIVPRAFTLAFDAETVSVVAGATAQVTLTVTGDRALAASDRFAVEFAYDPPDPDGGGVEVVALESVMFTAGSTAAVVMLEAATTATRGMLTALVLEAEGATVAPATLSVEITPRLFSLAFDAETVSVVAGGHDAGDVWR